jgi:hypothetical protein
MSVGMFRQFFEIVRVYSLDERNLERWDPHVGVTTFHSVYIAVDD